VGEQGTPKESQSPEKFIGHMYKYALFDLNQQISTKFSSQRLNYIHQKFHWGAVEDPPNFRLGVSMTPLLLELPMSSTKMAVSYRQVARQC